MKDKNLFKALVDNAVIGHNGRQNCKETAANAAIATGRTIKVVGK